MDYNTIEHLIAKEDFKNETLFVTFTCQETGVSQDAHIQVQQSISKKIMSSAKESAKTQMFRSAKRSLSRLIGSTLGHGMIGKIGRDITNSTLNEVKGTGQSKSPLSKEDREHAIVEAFEQVSNFFIWDKEKNKWIGMKEDAMPPFFQKIEEAPINDRYDKTILSRMLVEIAASDGDVSKEEKEFLSDFLPKEAGSIEELLQKDTLTKAELVGTSEGPVRESMILLTWGLAFSDDELSSSEKEKVNSFASNLGLNQEKQKELKEMAAQYVIDQMFTTIFSNGSFETDKKEVYSLANKLDVPEELIQKAEINFKKLHSK